mmetsp:Transcript_14308/g.40856  ORF Transcript_14308/g.40856 Transcript_14308/m.40856 type:complete len:322 (+) Transcript_14308:1244-2209(+)
MTMTMTGMIDYSSGSSKNVTHGFEFALVTGAPVLASENKAELLGRQVVTPGAPVEMYLILVYCEPPGLERDALFRCFTGSTLLMLKSLLFRVCLPPHAQLGESLVRPQTAIRRRQPPLHFWRDLIQSDRVPGQIVPVAILWLGHGIFNPYSLTTSALPRNVYLLVPVPLQPREPHRHAVNLQMTLDSSGIPIEEHFCLVEKHLGHGARAIPASPDRHHPAVVHVDLPDDQVVNSCGHLVPRIRVAVLEIQTQNALGLELDGSTPKLALDLRVPLVRPFVAAIATSPPPTDRMCCDDRRMVTDLLRDEPKSLVVVDEFVRLT